MKKKYIITALVIFVLLCSNLVYGNVNQNGKNNITIPNTLKLVQNNSPDYKSLLQKADELVNQGNYAESAKICYFLLTKNRNDLEVISLLYYCLCKQGATDAQIIKAIAPSQINQPYDQVYTNLAVLIITKTSHINIAKSMAERAKKINPNNRQINNLIYKAFIQINNNEEAKKYMK